jgi:VanZ family protein
VRALLKKRLWDWLPVVVWLGLIVIESTDLLSSGGTGSLLNWVISKLYRPISPASLEAINHALRKTGHFVGYGVLCVLFFRAIRDTFKGSLRRWSLLAIAFTFFVASADEIHQTYLSSRTGRFRDVLIDVCGAACLQLNALLLLRRRKERTAVVSR